METISLAVIMVLTILSCLLVNLFFFLDIYIFFVVSLMWSQTSYFLTYDLFLNSRIKLINFLFYIISLPEKRRDMFILRKGFNVICIYTKPTIFFYFHDHLILLFYPTYLLYLCWKKIFYCRVDIEEEKIG